MINRGMGRSGVALLALAVVSAMALGGCSNGPAPPLRTSTVTATPIPTASQPPSVPPSPTLPAAAQQPTRAGAEAFAEYFFAVYNYAFAVADPAPLQAISDANCVFCKSSIDAVELIRSERDRSEGGDVDVQLAVAAPGKPLDRLVVNLIVHQASGRTISANGEVAGTTAERRNGRIDMAVRWAEGRWIVLAADVLKDGES